MAFPSSFGAQVAAIMDVLAKAAVAEITKLVEDGSLVLRLEMSRRESEIQELRASLKLIEAELRKGQEAVASRQTEDKQAETTAENQVPREDKKEDLEMSALYLEPKAAQNGTEESQNIWPVVKHEPEDECANAETDKRVRADVCFKAEQDDSMWPACSTFERNSAALQQHIQIFPSDQYSAQRNTESSYNSLSSAAEETAAVPVRVEVETRPVCMGGITSESVHNKEFRHISPPAVSRGSQQAGPSLPLPHVETPTAISTRSNNENLNQTRDVFKYKRVMNVCRSNQKVFICSVCSKSFSYLSQLEKHKATHQSSKPFRCLECGKSFTQKTRLRTHQRVHTGEKPFSCKICGKMFSRKDNCMRHERFHSGLKPYSCRQCAKSFTALDKLKLHQEVHLQGR
ncbi:histone-lysine N-methyltransferase PRDM9-like [Archocentrus centrarchus]|uniref:histone-lysine N-methyltransferase PRDM9-like n=1 Tax=Archocentrus centrarchus TaxID=63155 RepID=UPI0011EA2EED|nr:histone-lysine N-methyltransferase PRDM9-like [Archocentrus centrarchus]